MDAITSLCSSSTADVPALGAARTNTNVAPSAQTNGTKLEYVGAKTTDPPREAVARSCALPQPKLWIEVSSAATVVLVSARGVTASSISYRFERCETSTAITRTQTSSIGISSISHLKCCRSADSKR